MSTIMKVEGPLLPEQKSISNIGPDSPLRSSGSVVFTRDHAVIRQWAQKRGAEPATGEATRSGPATVSVSDGGAGVRFNFPGASLFRPISWEEWLENFDKHELAFVFDDDDAEAPPLSNRYRTVKAAEWKDFLR